MCSPLPPKVMIFFLGFHACTGNKLLSGGQSRVAKTIITILIAIGLGVLLLNSNLGLENPSFASPKIPSFS